MCIERVGRSGSIRGRGLEARSELTIRKRGGDTMRRAGAGSRGRGNVLNGRHIVEDPDVLDVTKQRESTT